MFNANGSWSDNTGDSGSWDVDGNQLSGWEVDPLVADLVDGDDLTSASGHRKSDSARAGADL